MVGGVFIGSGVLNDGANYYSPLVLHFPFKHSTLALGKQLLSHPWKHGLIKSWACFSNVRFIPKSSHPQRWITEQSEDFVHAFHSLGIISVLHLGTFSSALFFPKETEGDNAKAETKNNIVILPTQ